MHYVLIYVPHENNKSFLTGKQSKPIIFVLNVGHIYVLYKGVFNDNNAVIVYCS